MSDNMYIMHALCKTYLQEEYCRFEWTKIRWKMWPANRVRTWFKWQQQWWTTSSKSATSWKVSEHAAWFKSMLKQSINCFSFLCLILSWINPTWEILQYISSCYVMVRFPCKSNITCLFHSICWCNFSSELWSAYKCNAALVLINLICLLYRHVSNAIHWFLGASKNEWFLCDLHGWASFGVWILFSTGDDGRSGIKIVIWRKGVWVCFLFVHVM